MLVISGRSSSKASVLYSMSLCRRLMRYCLWVLFMFWFSSEVSKYVVVLVMFMRLESYSGSMAYLDDRFTSGVWYDRRGEEYCRVVDLDGTVGLVDPDNPGGEPYYTFDEDGLEMSQAVDFLEKEFVRVPEEAVEGPGKFINGVLDEVQSEAELSERERAGLGFARQRVSVVDLEEW